MCQGKFLWTLDEWEDEDPAVMHHKAVKDLCSIMYPLSLSQHPLSTLDLISTSIKKYS